MAVDTRFPPAVQDVWAALDADVVWLHGHWIIYKQLFGVSAERVDILNRSAATFFVVIERMMLHDVQLSLSKLGDSAGTGTKTNLTLASLCEQLSRSGETVLCSRLESLIENFNDACAALRHRRNKLIAHADLTTILSSTVEPLEGPSRTEIEAALLALRSAMNCVASHFTQQKTAYEHFAMNSDGEHLIRALTEGLRYREMVRTKQIPFGDLRKNFK